MTNLKNRPLYKKISAELLRRMRADTYISGTLPSEEQLAAEFGASKHTIREALAELTSLSYINKRHGVGNLIMQSALDTQCRIDENSNFMQPLKLAGYNVNLIQRNFRVMEKAIRDEKPQQMYAYDEIMYADDTPASTHHMYLPVAVLGEEDVLSECPGESLFDIFIQRNITALHSVVEFVPEMPDAEIQKLFTLDSFSPINTWDETIYDDADHPICYTKIRFNPHVFPLRMVRRGFELPE